MHIVLSIILLITVLFTGRKKLVIALLCNANCLRNIVDNNVSKQMCHLRDKKNVCAIKLFYY